MIGIIYFIFTYLTLVLVTGNNLSKVGSLCEFSNFCELKEAKNI